MKAGSPYLPWAGDTPQVSLPFRDLLRMPGWAGLLVLCAQSPHLTLGTRTGLLSARLTPTPGWETPAGLKPGLFIFISQGPGARVLCAE